MAMFFGIDDLEWLLTNQADDFFALLIMIIVQFPLFSKVNTEKNPQHRGVPCVGGAGPISKRTFP